VSSAQRADEYYSRLRWVSDLVRFIGGFLPGFASTWINGYARAPFWFVVMLLVLTGLMVWLTRVASRTSNLMSSIWRQTPVAPTRLPDNWIYRLRSSKTYIAFHEGLKHKFAPLFFAIMFVYLRLSVLSHISFDMLDVAGRTCIDHAKNPAVPQATPLKVKEKRVIPFDISHLCTATGVELETDGARYYIKVDPSGEWSNGAFPIPVGGFSAQPNETASWYKRIYLTLFLPLRRELFKDWFRIVLRYGRTGGEEHVLEPDPTDPLIEDNIKPTRGGQLYIFVNDAVIGFPGLYGAFYRNNKGTGQLTVTRTR
jgi:hypothetical protein